MIYLYVYLENGKFSLGEKSSPYQIGTIQFSEPNMRDVKIHTQTTTRYFYILEQLLEPQGMWPYKISFFTADQASLETEADNCGLMIQRYVPDQVLSLKGIRITRNRSFSHEKWLQLQAKHKENIHQFSNKNQSDLFWRLLHVWREKHEFICLTHLISFCKNSVFYGIDEEVHAEIGFEAVKQESSNFKEIIEEVVKDESLKAQFLAKEN